MFPNLRQAVDFYLEQVDETYENRGVSGRIE
jgi:hypothetical protein